MDSAEERRDIMPEVGKPKREPSTLMSFLVFGTAITIILFGVVLFSLDIHITLLLAIIFVCVISTLLGYGLDDLIEFMKNALGQAMSAMIIFIFIGIIIAAWIFSGTVPTLIYYGLKYISPDWFLPTGLLLCSLTSLSIGTSWGTIGTMGIALMGIGGGLGIPSPITAGMIISGAFFGDKMSPVSDTTNLAPAASGTTLHKHINAMWKTTLPAYVITFIIFLILGFVYKNQGANQDTVLICEKVLTEHFVITPILLLPMIVLLILNLIHLPAIPVMIIGSFLAVIFAVVVQNTPISEVIVGLNYGYVKSTGVCIVDNLLCRGGIQNMMYTFSLSCIAIAFGGIMEHVGYLRRIVTSIIGHIKHNKSIVPIVIISTTLGTLTMGEVYLSIVVNGNLYRETFKKRGLRLEMLSRLLEEGGTLTQCFIPWSTTGVFIFATLGVAAKDYWKFAVLNYVNPILSIIMALLGYGILYERTVNSSK